ncbi:transcription-repair coupling factor [Consotaella salsifontis]|uniref:Transcription-repair-coupling factor n=1 Tax=Consotaella salsifontis TaxID=1365950 RepID=A0A1T4RA05_9HYPH|nr:transcription-repair coupling factor [Consotaella salsifontis]SKA12864.1 transcription-repair coupling factor (superfamily II helicase) [Consotaella salsifontis]
MNIAVNKSASDDRLLMADDPIGAVAVDLLDLIEQTVGGPLFYVARDELRARALYEVLRALASDLGVAHFPGWDCPPYVSASPSRAVMGQRMGVLRWLTDRRSPPSVVITTPDALLRLVPPPSIWPKAHIAFRAGEPIDPEAVNAALTSVGYIVDERVDEPGEVAIRGRVIEVFPAASPLPCRIEYEDGLITTIHTYDPATQRTTDEAEELTIDPASEIVAQEAPLSEAGREEAREEKERLEPAPGREHWLSSFYPELVTVFDYAPGRKMLLENGAAERAAMFLDIINESYESELALRSEAATRPAPATPHRLFVDRAEWKKAMADRALEVATDLRCQKDRTVPRFAANRAAASAFRSYVSERLEAGGRVVLTGPDTSLDRLRRRASRLLRRSIEPAKDWQDVMEAAPSSLLSLVAPIERGFVSKLEDIAIVAASDLFGSHAQAAGLRKPDPLATEEVGFRIGQPVVHRDHGIGILDGLEEIAQPDGGAADAVRLCYEGGATLLVPVEEIDRLWSYGGDASVSLDRLSSESWAKRRAELESAIEAAAERLTEAARERRSRKAPELVPEAARYERFVGRFGYTLTPDQASAIDAVLSDLASGRRMDRLICGDVGYGKTEVALRAIAAAAFAGKQVAFVAPTTVLVRQHLRTLARRFAGTGIEVAELSRMVKPADARRVKAGLEDGTIRVVVGTHAVAAKGVAFADLGLVVIDEEQRFGARVKTQLKKLTDSAHVLTLTATPIPRSLQASLVGLQDLSMIETPPVARQPVRTIVAAFDESMVREALRREKARGGQSFVVCPRIDDLESMGDRLRALAPELRLVSAHGEMAPAEIDGVMLGFADGEGDVLLATNIIESGLDVPNANTMIVWQADRFGLAQLHQLRGRVGRGARRGTVLLMTEASRELGEEAEQRLRSLERLDQLGAGFRVSTRDLELRGAGDLLGEEQAGHLRLIGTRLYRHLLDRAIGKAEGETLEDEWMPVIRLGLSGRIPKDYIPEEEVRLDLYARFAEAGDSEVLADLESEVDDRFGAIPEEMADLFALAQIRVRCREAGIADLDGGPQALAARFRPHRLKAIAKTKLPPDMEWVDDRLLLRRKSASPRERLGLARALLDVLVPGASIGTSVSS